MPVDAVLHRRLAPEGRLLMLAAGPAENDAGIRELLAGPLDWPHVYWMAERERATLPVFRRIEAVAPGQVPGQVREAFQRRAMVAGFTAAYLEQRLGETLVALQGAGIEAVLLKGAALAVSVYDGFADRPMGDVDVLVAQAHAEQAWRVAQRAGWSWDESLHPLANYVGHHHLPPLVGARGMDVKLEVHAALFVQGHPFSLGLEEMRAGASSVRIGRGEALVPEPAKLLLHVALHYAWSHMMAFGGWRAFRDVGALVPRVTDWEGFLELARRNRAETVCYWTLRMAELLTGAPVPGYVLGRLSRERGVIAGGAIERHLAGDVLPGPNVCPSAMLRRWMWGAAIRPVGSGHGRVRPWTLDDSLMETPMVGGGRKGLMDRAIGHLGRLGTWAGYARGLLGAGASGTR